ncbi:hypothetical protein DFS34DRAFT_590536 [Phlyctochytrium arcticum]|nr:hypothetical protein DFS34DRAFT_590536 [Phlyctochytrium arcticum]
MANGAYCLAHPAYGKHVLVREAYKIWEEIDKNPTLKYVICGTPVTISRLITITSGIGKTFFSNYLMWQIRKKYDTAVIVYSSQLTESIARYFAFLPNGEPRTRRRFMPLWSWEEIEAVVRKCFPHFRLDDVRRVVAFWGMIPRNIVIKCESGQLDQKHLEDSDSLNSDLALAKCFEVIYTETYPTAAISGQVLHLWTEKPYVDKVVKFASIPMADKLLRLCGESLQEKIRHFISTAANTSNLAGLRGNIFEAFSHRRLMRGGKFTIRNLSTKKEDELVLSPVGETVVFKDFDEMVDNTYNRPISRSIASVDSLYTPLKLFQMTVSCEHEIKARSGLKPLIDHLDSDEPLQFFFVVPTERFESFREQQVVNSDGKPYQKPGDFLNRIQQYVLRLDVAELGECYGWGNK